MKKLTLSLLLLLPFPSHAAFDGNEVPKTVQVLPCDSNPRILVIFNDPAKNIWYPFNDGDNSKAFLSVALAAKAANAPMYFLGSGSATDLTSYCNSHTARRVMAFGLN